MGHITEAIQFGLRNPQIPKIWGSMEQKHYVKFTRPFFPHPNEKGKK